MNLNQLTYFVSVAEQQSFTLAARENFITQTAITQQIRQLEEQLGLELIDRSTRPISLTVAGEIFYKEAKGILERMDYAVRSTREASRGAQGSLRIGYTKGYERSELSNELRRFHRKHPGIFVTCVRGAADELAAQLLSGELDIVYSWDSAGLSSDPSVVSALRERVPLSAVLYASHRLAGRPSVRREDLKNEPIILLTPSKARDAAADAHYLELYTRAGYSPNIVLYSNDAESVLMMVAAEEGISIMPEYFTRKLDHADNLLFVPMEGEDEVEEIRAFYRKDDPNLSLKIYLEDGK